MIGMYILFRTFQKVQQTHFVLLCYQLEWYEIHKSVPTDVGNLANVYSVLNKEKHSQVTEGKSEATKKPREDYCHMMKLKIKI